MTSTSNSTPRSAETTTSASTASGRWLLLCAVAAIAVLMLDQVTKALVRARLDLGDTWPAGWELLRITHVRNTGAAFGILPDATVFLTVASVVMCVVIVVMVLRVAGSRPWYALALSVLLGGAVGNQVDRVRLGYVTDFIDPARYPSFNVADSAVVIGIVALILLSIFERDEHHATAEEASNTPVRAEHGHYDTEYEGGG